MSPAPRHWGADSIFTFPGNPFKTLKGEFFGPFKSAVSQNHQKGLDKPFQAAGVTARQTHLKSNLANSIANKAHLFSRSSTTSR
jgi:hypothetical protein